MVSGVWGKTIFSKEHLWQKTAGAVQQQHTKHLKIVWTEIQLQLPSKQKWQKPDRNHVRYRTFTSSKLVHHDYFPELTIMNHERNPRTHTILMDTELETQGETSDMKTSMMMTSILEREGQGIRTGLMWKQTTSSARTAERNLTRSKAQGRSQNGKMCMARLVSQLTGLSMHFNGQNNLHYACDW